MGVWAGLQPIFYSGDVPQFVLCSPDTPFPETLVVSEGLRAA